MKDGLKGKLKRGLLLSGGMDLSRLRGGSSQI